ncbi:MAG TPA: hypothetical protein VFZ26_11830 [Gemmatimonadales bacterium]
MRNYWLKILLGAFAIFAIGMVGVTLIRSGAAHVRGMVEGDDPLTIPLAFIPFTLEGERLGTVKRLVVYRSEPQRVSGVEVYIDVGDSLMAQGLSECRLAADLEGKRSDGGVNIEAGRGSEQVFSCLAGDSVPADLSEFGEAVFDPGEVRVPLYLHNDLVAELQEGFAGDSAMITAADADSIAAEARRQVDSALAEAGLSRDAAGPRGRRLGDSLRAAARARLDSLRSELPQPDVADTQPTP